MKFGNVKKENVIYFVFRFSFVDGEFFLLSFSFGFDNAIPPFGQKVELGRGICNSNSLCWKSSSLSRGRVFLLLAQ